MHTTHPHMGAALKQARVAALVRCAAMLCVLCVKLFLSLRRAGNRHA